jgi:hypothetical protein
VAKKKATSKRERLSTPRSTQYAKRTRSGQFSAMDEVGRSQKADRRTKAKATVKPGHGDQKTRSALDAEFVIDGRLPMGDEHTPPPCPTITRRLA